MLFYGIKRDNVVDFDGKHLSNIQLVCKTDWPLILGLNVDGMKDKSAFRVLEWGGMENGGRGNVWLTRRIKRTSTSSGHLILTPLVAIGGVIFAICRPFKLKTPVCLHHITFVLSGLSWKGAGRRWCGGWRDTIYTLYNT